VGPAEGAYVVTCYDQDGITLYVGDCLEVLAALPPESVDCVVTSPPYWSLRRYAGAGTVWGGDPECAHEFTGTADGGCFCRCGAWRGEYGLEQTPELYVEHSIMVLRAIWRVLTPTGVVWWNIADSYAGSGKGGNPEAGKQATNRGSESVGVLNVSGTFTAAHPFLKPKDMVLIPQRVALAAQADGWYVRCDVIWSKPNPMPESVTDRPTKSHEYIWLLSKSEHYYWDQDAVREPFTDITIQRITQESIDSQKGGFKQELYPHEGGRNIRSVWKADEPLVMVRGDLSDADRAYVLGELAKRGL
jgi:DNA modification methylase